MSGSGGGAASGATAVPGVRSAVPRLLLNGAGPVGAFYLGSRVGGTLGGIAAATGTSLLLYAWERRRGRPGILARLALVVIALQVTAGLIGRSAELYFLPKVAVDLVEGAAFLLSCRTRRPLAGLIAGELVAVSAATRADPAVRRVFVRLSLVWGGYFTLRGLLCLWVLLTAGVPVFLVVRALADAPAVIALAAGSLRWGARRLREVPA